MGLTSSKTIIPIKEADAKLGPSLRMKLDKVRSQTLSVIRLVAAIKCAPFVELGRVMALNAWHMPRTIFRLRPHSAARAQRKSNRQARAGAQKAALDSLCVACCRSSDRPSRGTSCGVSQAQFVLLSSTTAVSVEQTPGPTYHTAGTHHTRNSERVREHLHARAGERQRERVSKSVPACLLRILYLGVYAISLFPHEAHGLNLFCTW